MPNIWNEWEGQTLNGKFQLVRYLGGSEQCAVFLTQRQEKQHLVNAAIKIIRGTPEEAERQLARWQQTTELSHPHLIPLYEMGRFELDGVPFVYAVMECADENLSQVVPARALTADEAREVLTSIVDILSYLHEKGFVHGGIRPAHIMASGDQLKLSSDALRRAGETLEDSAEQNVYVAPELSGKSFPMPQRLSPGSDSWSLGMTLVEALTQKLPAVRPIDRQDPFVPVNLPEPFLDIAKHCLVRNPQARWKAEQIRARLEGRAPEVEIPKVEVAVPLPVPVPAVENRAPESKLPPVVRSFKPVAKRNRYAAPFAIGFAVVVGAILVFPRVVRHRADAQSPQEIATADNPATAATSANEHAPASDQRAIESRAVQPSYSDEKSNSKAPVPIPALVHPEAMREEPTNMVARVPVDSASRGSIAHKVMPEVLQSARNSIHGTVKVSVKVDVDGAGNVEDAELASRGPSRYFAKAALQAAQNWKFNPPRAGDRGVLSSWILRFEFTRGETTVSPTQEMP